MVRAVIPHIGVSPHRLRLVCRRCGILRGRIATTTVSGTRPRCRTKAGVEVYRYARPSAASPVRICRNREPAHVSARSCCALWRRLGPASTRALRSVVRRRWFAGTDRHCSAPSSHGERARRMAPEDVVACAPGGRLAHLLRAARRLSPIAAFIELVASASIESCTAAGESA